jgi:plasmid stabilization system protein ParE
VTQYQVNISDLAKKEIEEFYLYIAEDSPENAKKWYFSIYDKIQTLRNFPMRSPIADEDIFHEYETSAPSSLHIFLGHPCPKTHSARAN